MKNNFLKWCSSRLFTIVPLIILMCSVNDCSDSFTKEILGINNPFVQTNKGRNIVAYRKDGEEFAYSPHNCLLLGGFGSWLSQKDGINELEIQAAELWIQVYSEEMFEIGEKYSVGDTLSMTSKPAFRFGSLYSKSISGWLKFRYFKDGIAAGNFETVIVECLPPFDTLRITDGTFDVKYEVQ